MEVAGKVIQVFQPTKYTSRKDGSEQFIYGFLIETVNEQYKKKMAMQVFGSDKWNQFRIQVGSDYTFRFDVGSREYNGRWFTELTCFAAFPLTAHTQGGGQQQVPQSAAPTPPVQAPAAGDDSDLPF